MAYEVEGQPIVAGYPFSMRLNATVGIFTAGSTYTAMVRDVETDTLLATLTTANGKLVRVDDNNLDVLLAQADSSSWLNYASVVLDIVRTDTNPDQYLGIKITLMVEYPATRGLP